MQVRQREPLACGGATGACRTPPVCEFRTFPGRGKVRNSQIAGGHVLGSGKLLFRGRGNGHMPPMSSRQPRGQRAAGSGPGSRRRAAGGGRRDPRRYSRKSRSASSSAVVVSRNDSMSMRSSLPWNSVRNVAMSHSGENSPNP